jgi:hypothetical protein
MATVQIFEFKFKKNKMKSTIHTAVSGSNGFDYED